MVDAVNLNGEAAIHQYADFNYVDLIIDMDLNGFTGRAMLKREFADTEGTEFALEFVSRDRPATIKPKLTNAQTAALTPGTYKWDLWVRPGEDGEITVLCRGNVTVEAGVTPNANN